METDFACRHGHGLGTLGLALLLILAAGCRPADKSMFVSYVQGDVFLPNLGPGNWNFGETQRCEIASRGSVSPDQRGDLLLCGEKTQLAWSQSWLRPDIRAQIYQAAKTLKIVFHSTEHSGGRGASPSWQCKRTAEGVDCE